MRFSIIIPVYNRPDEIDELLQSLTRQTVTDFEVVVIEDGSSVRCAEIIDKYLTMLDIRYFYKENSGPGTSRNYGAERSRGDYLIFLDSDCIAPPGYINEVCKELSVRDIDVFGGPDRACENFSDKQKAINYSMTSFLTTGGIRGQKTRLDKFHPRSFNMGVKRQVFSAIGGFSNMRFGEDIDFSYRVIENSFSSGLFPDAWVYHKRRTNFRQFFKQTFNSGIARIKLSKKHQGTLKFVHLLPAIFTVGCGLILIASVWKPIVLSLFAVFCAVILTDATIKTGSLRIGILSVGATFTQLIGYGSGFVYGLWKFCLCKNNTHTVSNKKFYK